MFDTKLLAKLDSATKYPSIPTFHELGDRGILQESGNPFAGYQGPIVATEKVIDELGLSANHSSSSRRTSGSSAS